MRFTVTMLIVVQLLVRGLAVSHSHASEGQPEPVGHANRPHLHLIGHSHSHTYGHEHGDRNRSHHRPHQHDDSDSPVVPDPAAPLSDSSEHDQDAVYVDGETLGMPSDRIETSNPTDVIGLVADFVSRESEILPHLGICHAAGPPGLGSGTSIDLLPHLLRV
ncbi:MAG: hypothetical protein JWN70_4524 [Planctomycetaceae bacterium]|nr:hypothetical protein [Planctomycetaceae bacterium]